MKDRFHHLGDERDLIKKKKDKFNSLSSFLRRKATFVASSSSQIFQYVVVIGTLHSSYVLLRCTSLLLLFPLLALDPYEILSAVFKITLALQI
jgi:hypothetical protein